MKLEHVLARKGGAVVVVPPEELVRETLALLAAPGVGAVLVAGQDGRLSGIFTKRDAVRSLIGGEVALSRPVSEVMTREVIVAFPDDDVRAVVHTMIERSIRHLPVLIDGRVAGIVTIADVVKAERDEYLGQVETLLARISEGFG